MNKTNDEKRRLPEKTSDLCRLYEQLREYALNASDNPGWAVYGFGVILLRGMAAWIEAAMDYVELDHPVENRALSKSVQLKSSEQTQLSEILAGIFIRHGQVEVS